MNKIKISSDFEKIEKSKNDLEIIDTNNPKIKIVIVNKSTKPLIIRVSDDIETKINEVDKYFFKDEFENLIELNWKKFKVISVISNQWYIDKNYFTNDHISMETIDEFKWLWLVSEMFKIKNLVDKTLNKTAESFVSNISLLLKNWYQVVWKLDRKTWKMKEFKWQEFIKRIIEIKIKNWKFLDKLSDTYMFEKK